MKSGSECITVLDSIHTYDKKMGFASEKIKNLSSNTRLEEDKASYSRIQQECSSEASPLLLSPAPQIAQYRLLMGLSFRFFPFLPGCELKETPSGQVSSAGGVV